MGQRSHGCRHRIGIGGLTLLAAACGAGEQPSEPLTFQHVYIQRTCAPWDGPATTLYLADREVASGVVPRPMLMISVYESVSRASGKRYVMRPDDHDVGAALACATADGCDAFPEAVVEFGQLEELVPAQVTVRVKRGDGGVAEARFTATWLQPADICG